MTNIFATPVDTFAMSSGLYNAFAQGQKNTEELATSKIKRAETEQKIAETQQKMQQDNWKMEQEMRRQRQAQPFSQPSPQSYAAGLVQAAAGYPFGQMQTTPFGYRLRQPF